MSCLSIRSVRAAVLSFAIAITALGASAPQARADNTREAAAVIGGLIALYAIGRALQNQTDHATPPPPHRPVQVVPHPRSLYAPNHCYIEGYDGHRMIRGYVRRCMVNTVARPHLLPDSCLRQVHTHRGPRNIYARRCLSRNGWTVS